VLAEQRCHERRRSLNILNAVAAHQIATSHPVPLKAAAHVSPLSTNAFSVAQKVAPFAPVPAAIVHNTQPLRALSGGAGVRTAERAEGRPYSITRVPRWPAPFALRTRTYFVLENRRTLFLSP
jgi:hypothetical protein